MAQAIPVDPDVGLIHDRIARGLERDGYIVLPDALPGVLVDDLFVHFNAMDGRAFERAGIGRDGDYQLNRFIRSDQIHWLDGTVPATAAWFAWAEHLRLGLNRRLFLGLFDYECHYAWYERGAFYRKHVDAFRGGHSRVISTVLYLNPQWRPEDGGELLIYHPGTGAVQEKVEPRFGTLVLFLSEEFPHEVLPVKRPRYSLTGWFRVNNSLGESIDPIR